jgi:hypothetical protein
LFLAIVLIAAAMEWVGRHRERAVHEEGTVQPDAHD